MNIFAFLRPRQIAREDKATSNPDALSALATVADEAAEKPATLQAADAAEGGRPWPFHAILDGTPFCRGPRPEVPHDSARPLPPEQLSHTPKQPTTSQE